MTRPCRVAALKHAVIPIRLLREPSSCSSRLDVDERWSPPQPSRHPGSWRVKAGKSSSMPRAGLSICAAHDRYFQGFHHAVSLAPNIDAKRLKRVLDFIEVRFAEDIALRDLAAEAHLSAFRNATGLTPGQYRALHQA